MPKSTKPTSAQKLVLAAQRLFFKQGLKKTSVESICLEAGLSKVTFYKHFKNKMQVALGVTQKLIDEGQNSFNRINQKDISFQEKVKHIIAEKMANADEMGDVFISELFADQHTELISLMSEAALKQKQLMLDFLKTGQQEGVIRKDISDELLWFSLESLDHMVRESRLSSFMPDTKQRLKWALDFFFYGLGQPS